MRKGDDVLLLPSGFVSKIKKIDSFDGEVEEAFPPMSVTVLIEDDYDLSRGDMIVRTNNKPESTQDLDLMICWFDQEKKLQLRGKYRIQHTTREARCIVKSVLYKMNVNTLHREDDNEIGMNDIARVSIRTTVPLFVDPYRKNRITGSVVLIDEVTNSTVAAGMVVG